MLQKWIPFPTAPINPNCFKWKARGGCLKTNITSNLESWSCSHQKFKPGLHPTEIHFSTYILIFPPKISTMVSHGLNVVRTDRLQPLDLPGPRPHGFSPRFTKAEVAALSAPLEDRRTVSPKSLAGRTRSACVRFPVSVQAIHLCLKGDTKQNWWGGDVRTSGFLIGCGRLFGCVSKGCCNPKAGVWEVAG